MYIHIYIYIYMYINERGTDCSINRVIVIIKKVTVYELWLDHISVWEINNVYICMYINTYTKN